MASTTPVDPDALGFNLLENALDYLRASVRALRDDADPRELKYAVLSLAAAMELLHKELLLRSDWRLVFERLHEADPATLAAGTFRSVGPEKAIRRLRKHAGVALDTDQKALLKSLRDRRNRIQHFQ